MDGGGGGGGQQQSAQPTTSTVNNVSVPPELMPYAHRVLGQGEALTDINKNPYQQYGGSRVAGFSPMQNQAFQNVGNMQPAGQLGTGTDMAASAGLGSMGAGQQYGQMATNPGAMGAYMSPYMQNAVDWQKQQAVSDYGRRLPGMGAAATQANAFGGTRQALVESEGQRNLQNQLAGIQAQGTQSAFDNAQKSMQFGTTTGLQGYGQGVQAAGALGQLGQTQYGQQMGINQGQMQAGAQQQALDQQGLSNQHQDFLNQQNYPYRNLGFMSDLVRGMPLTQQSSTVYQAPPNSTTQTIGMLGGLGSMAAGFGMGRGAAAGGAIKGFADGGAVQGFNDGGLAEMQDMYGMLPPGVVSQAAGNPNLSLVQRIGAQLREEQNGATYRGQDMAQYQPRLPVIDQPGGLEGGLGHPGAPQVDPLLGSAGMADGGIVAFAEGDAVEAQTRADRKAVAEGWGWLKDNTISGAQGLGAAAMDVGALPYRAIAGAGNAAVIRPLRALGADTPYMPSDPFGGDGSSMTPFTDRLRQVRGEAGAPAGTTPVRPITQAPATPPLEFAPPSNTPAPPGGITDPEVVAPASAAPAGGIPNRAPRADTAVNPWDARLQSVVDAPGPKNLSKEELSAQAKADRTAALRDEGVTDEGGYKDRLNTLKTEAVTARTDRDRDRAFAVAAGFFGMAGGKSQYASQNIADGFGIGLKQFMSVEKDFKEMDRLRRQEQIEARKGAIAQADGNLAAVQKAYDRQEALVERHDAKKMEALTKLSSSWETNETRKQTAKDAAAGRGVQSAAIAAQREATLEHQKAVATERQQAAYNKALEDAKRGEIAGYKGDILSTMAPGFADLMETQARKIVIGRNPSWKKFAGEDSAAPAGYTQTPEDRALVAKNLRKP